MMLSPSMDTTVLVLSPLGMQVVSVELGPDDEVGLKLPFLPRLKVLLFILNTCALWLGDMAMRKGA